MSSPASWACGLSCDRAARFAASLFNRRSRCSLRVQSADLFVTIRYAQGLKPAGTRHYREALGKLREAVDHFRKDRRKDRAEFLVETGDLVDAADDAATELAYLKKIDSEYARFPGDRHYVFGNHCVFTLTKEQSTQQRISLCSFGIRQIAEQPPACTSAQRLTERAESLTDGLSAASRRHA